MKRSFLVALLLTLSACTVNFTFKVENGPPQSLESKLTQMERAVRTPQ